MNTQVVEYVLPSRTTLQLVQGDITAESSDAIVNAANENLIHGSGVAGAVSRRGGPDIQTESDAWVRKNGPVSHAEPAWTSGGRLPCRYVIHAVGPVWGSGNEDTKLDAAVTGCLRVADELGLRSISLPAISTGIFGFPKERAAGIIYGSIGRYFEKNSNSAIKTVRLVIHDPATVGDFLKAWHDHINT